MKRINFKVKLTKLLTGKVFLGTDFEKQKENVISAMCELKNSLI
jgi:hypothetical protein